MGLFILEETLLHQYMPNIIIIINGGNMPMVNSYHIHHHHHIMITIIIIILSILIINLQGWGLQRELLTDCWAGPIQTAHCSGASKMMFSYRTFEITPDKKTFSNTKHKQIFARCMQPTVHWTVFRGLQYDVFVQNIWDHAWQENIFKYKT